MLRHVTITLLCLLPAAMSHANPVLESDLEPVFSQLNQLGYKYIRSFDIQNGMYHVTGVDKQGGNFDVQIDAQMPAIVPVSAAGECEDALAALKKIGSIGYSQVESMTYQNTSYQFTVYDGQHIKYIVTLDQATCAADTQMLTWFQNLISRWKDK